MTTSPQLRESPDTTKFQVFPFPTSILLGFVMATPDFLVEHRQLHARLIARAPASKSKTGPFPNDLIVTPEKLWADEMQIKGEMSVRMRIHAAEHHRNFRRAGSCNKAEKRGGRAAG